MTLTEDDECNCQVSVTSDEKVTSKKIELTEKMSNEIFAMQVTPTSAILKGLDKSYSLDFLGL